MTTKKTKFSDQRFDFTLNINNHIICKRYFSIDNYNEQVVKSVELKELMDELVGMDGYYKKYGMIPNLLRKYAEDFLWNNYNPYFTSTNSEEKKNIFENEDIFTFEIRVDDKVVVSSSFSGNWFPTYVRYKVNIREIVPQIIESISNTFTRRKYTKSYVGVEL